MKFMSWLHKFQMAVRVPAAEIFGLAFAPIYIAATDSSQLAYRQLPFFFGAGYAIVKEELE
jgi:hypothetical protein